MPVPIPSRVPRRIWGITLLAVLAVGWAAAFAVPAQEDEDYGDLLRRSDRILEEAERQHYVGARMGAAIRGFRSIILDLKSNELLKPKEADQLLFAVEILEKLTESHVPQAASHLEEARKILIQMRPKLKAARTEIDIILEELEKLLARTNAAQATEAFERAHAEMMAQLQQGSMEVAQLPQQGQQQQPTQMTQESQQPSSETNDQERSPGEKRDPKGRSRAREDAQWRSLGDRERDALYQGYIRDLPVEYREMLEDYYETLAK